MKLLSDYYQIYLTIDIVSSILLISDCLYATKKQFFCGKSGIITTFVLIFYVLKDQYKILYK